MDEKPDGLLRRGNCLGLLESLNNSSVQFWTYEIFLKCQKYKKVAEELGRGKTIKLIDILVSWFKESIGNIVQISFILGN